MSHLIPTEVGVAIINQARRSGAANTPTPLRQVDLDWKSRCPHVSLPVSIAARNLSRRIHVRLYASVRSHAVDMRAKCSGNVFNAGTCFDLGPLRRSTVVQNAEPLSVD